MPILSRPLPTCSILILAGYDLFPLETLENKKKVLKQAFEEHWLLIFQHDPKVRMGYLRKIDKRFEIDEVKVY